jgi:HSP20 family molecular chaperone IbpA
MSTALKKQSEREMASAGAERTRNRPAFQPRVDICELQSELVLVADMPGVEPGGIDVHFENGILTIFGKVQNRQSDGTRYIWNEYGLGDYHRTFQVSEVIDSGRITAEYSDGQLALHLPKVEAAQPRKIEVKSK